MRSTLDASMTVRERFEESDRFFAGCGIVHTTLHTLALVLEQHGMDYAIMGAMALKAHGYGRTTTNVDVLVRRGAFELFASASEFLGFAATGEHRGRTFCHRQTGCPITFFLTGEYPGDGKPNPVAFPDPASSAIDVQGVKVINLPTLVTLKLASGMTAPARLRDLADVQDLIRTLALEVGFANELDPYVREPFLTLW